MIYQKEVDELIKLSGIASQLSEEELESAKIIMNADLMIGVENGVSIEKQMILCKALVNKKKSENANKH